MLENTNLNKSDEELRNTADVQLVAKLSFWAYLPSFFYFSLSCFILYLFIVHRQEILLFISQTMTSGVAWPFLRTITQEPSRLYQSLQQLPLHSEYLYLFWLVLFCPLCLVHLLNLIRLRKTTLIVDEMGIWLKSGLLPFTTEVRGVVWKNADLASSRNTLLYYLFDNYPLVIRNRYSGLVELKTPPLQQGRQALSLINKTLTQKYNQE